MKLKALFIGILINFCFTQLAPVYAMDDSQKEDKNPSRKRSVSPSREKDTFTKKLKKDCLKFCKAKELYNTDDEQDKEIGRKALKWIVQDKNSWRQTYAANFLYKSNNQEDKEIGREALILLAQNKSSPFGQADAAIVLYKSDIPLSNEETLLEAENP